MAALAGRGAGPPAARQAGPRDRRGRGAPRRRPAPVGPARRPTSSSPTIRRWRSAFAWPTARRSCCTIRSTHAVGAAHAGWRGTAAGAAARGRPRDAARPSDRGPSDLVAAIGPCLGACCGEVGPGRRRGVPRRRRGPRVAGRVVLAGRRRSVVPGSRARQPRSTRGARACNPDAIFASGLCTKTHRDAAALVPRRPRRRGPDARRDPRPVPSERRESEGRSGTASRRAAASSGRRPAARGARRRRRWCLRAGRAPPGAPGAVAPTPLNPGRSVKLIEMSIGITDSLAGAERQAQRKVGVSRARVLQIERALQRAQPQAERIRIGDSRPQPYAGAADALEANLGGLIGDLFEARRLDERAETAERIQLAHA